MLMVDIWDKRVENAEAVLDAAIQKFIAAYAHNPHCAAPLTKERTQASGDVILAKAAYTEMKKKIIAADDRQKSLCNAIAAKYDNGEIDVYRYNAEMVRVKNLTELTASYLRMMPYHVAVICDLCQVAADYYNLASDVLRGKERVVA